MKRTKIFSKQMTRYFLMILLLAVFQLNSFSQISVYQYRNVPDKNIEEFLKRETTYWSKVAEKAVANKNDDLLGAT